MPVKTETWMDTEDEKIKSVRCALNYFLVWSYYTQKLTSKFLWLQNHNFTTFF